MAEMILKPCPFCGGEAKPIKHSFWDERTQSFSDKTYSIVCCVCSASTYPFYRTEEEAVDAWNRRTDNG
jgi:Lar family restriction alleviation protein